MTDIKIKLRSSMTDNKLIALTILRIESDVVCRISFDDIVNGLASKNRDSVICKLAM
jgi:hypothetical protein